MKFKNLEIRFCLLTIILQLTAISSIQSEPVNPVLIKKNISVILTCMDSLKKIPDDSIKLVRE